MAEPSALLPIARFGCRNLVCVGDPKQLAPVVSTDSEHHHGLEQSLFERLSKTVPTYAFIILRTQYRCHPAISALANAITYDGVLLDGVTAEDRSGLVPGLLPLRFHNVDRGRDERVGQSFVNQEEATVIISMVELILESGFDPKQIGVIATYKAQSTLIVEKLKASKVTGSALVLVSTVDAFQGGEKEVIFLSAVKTQSTSFIDSNARTNVVRICASLFSPTPLPLPKNSFAHFWTHSCHIPATAIPPSHHRPSLARSGTCSSLASSERCKATRSGVASYRTVFCAKVAGSTRPRRWNSCGPSSRSTPWLTAARLLLPPAASLR